ncbi:MAG: hypothetical protein AAF830_04215 [Pseudomonadota bacterium]
MKRTTRGLLAALSLALPAFSAADAGQKQVIQDPFGFERALDAYTLTIPDGWQMQGSVQWGNNPRCALDNQKVHFVTSNPQTGERIEGIPGGAWVWGSLYDVMPQLMQEADCRPIRILDVQTFMREYVPAIRPGAKILSTKPRPDLAQKGMAEIKPGMLQPGQRPRLEVAQVDLQYTKEGQQVNEVLIGSILFIDQPVQTMVPGQHWMTLAVAPITGSVSSVSGKPNVGKLESVMETVEIVPAYEQRMAQYFNNAMQATAQRYARKNAARRAYLRSMQASRAQTQATNNDILDSSMDSWRRRNDMTDRSASRVADAMAERTPWTNTDGNTVYMPQEYQRVYQLPNDVYVGTNDPFFNPVQQTGQFGTELGNPY